MFSRIYLANFSQKIITFLKSRRMGGHIINFRDGEGRCGRYCLLLEMLCTKVPRVRIPNSPPKNKGALKGVLVLLYKQHMRTLASQRGAQVLRVQSDNLCPTNTQNRGSESLTLRQKRRENDLFSRRFFCPTNNPTAALRIHKAFRRSFLSATTATSGNKNEFFSKG